MIPTVQSADDLRALVARRQITRYQLAAKVGVHPGRLGQMLNGKLPLPAELAERLSEVLMSDAE
jgi:plasmid maintenance system antidote protein VapI